MVDFLLSLVLDAVIYLWGAFDANRVSQWQSAGTIGEARIVLHGHQARGCDQCSRCTSIDKSLQIS